ncbi:MAG: lipid II flippase MurJ, partial [Pseudomonadota bacterium]
MSLTRAIFTVGGLTLISRVFGFARDLLTAIVLGAGPVADAFFVALKLPNFFRRLFAEGAFSAAFVPMVSQRIEADGPEAGREFAQRALALMIYFLVPFVVLGVIFMPALVTVLAPGFI